jgi:cell division protein FtsL
VSVNDTPIFEQTPQITEFVRERIDSPVFTTDKFNAVEETAMQATTFAPVATQAVQMQATAAVAVESQYSLTQFAKMVIAAFAAAVIVMLSLICVNTQLIRQKTVEYDALQMQSEQLQAEYAQLQARIQQATSPETIAEYALSQGMIQA